MKHHFAIDAKGTEEHPENHQRYCNILLSSTSFISLPGKGRRGWSFRTTHQLKPQTTRPILADAPEAVRLPGQLIELSHLLGQLTIAGPKADPAHRHPVLRWLPEPTPSARWNSWWKSCVLFRKASVLLGNAWVVCMDIALFSMVVVAARWHLLVCLKGQALPSWPFGASRSYSTSTGADPNSLKSMMS